VKHPVNIAVLIVVLISCFSCGNSKEKEKEMILQQISMTEDQVDGIESGRSKLQNDLNGLRIKVADLNGELSKSNARIVASKKFEASLRHKLLGPPDETPLQYIARKPAFTQKVVWTLLLCLFVLWLLWRIKHNQNNGATTQEIDRVIKRLSKEASKKSEAKKETVIKKPDPVEEKIAAAPQTDPVKKEQEPVPVSEPEKQPAPVPEKPVKEEAKKPKPKPKKAAAKKKPAAEKKTTKRTAKKKIVRRAPAKKCKVKGCNNKHRSKGYCNKHYQQWRRGTLEEE
jgi:hypothetical protein